MHALMHAHSLYEYVALMNGYTDDACMRCAVRTCAGLGTLSWSFMKQSLMKQFLTKGECVTATPSFNLGRSFHHFIYFYLLLI